MHAKLFWRRRIARLTTKGATRRTTCIHAYGLTQCDGNGVATYTAHIAARVAASDTKRTYLGIPPAWHDQIFDDDIITLRKDSQIHRTRCTNFCFS